MAQIQNPARMSMVKTVTFRILTQRPPDPGERESIQVVNNTVTVANPTENEGDCSREACDDHKVAKDPRVKDAKPRAECRCHDRGEPYHPSHIECRADR